MFNPLCPIALEHSRLITLFRWCLKTVHLPPLNTIWYTVPCLLAFKLATGRSYQVALACALKSRAGLCEWPTSSVKAHQEFSSLSLSSLSPPPPSIFHTPTLLLSPPPFFTLYHLHSRCFCLACPLLLPHAFMLSTIHTDPPPLSVVSEASVM